MASAAAARAAEGVVCPRCHAGEIVPAGAEGHASCNRCGHVMEESNIVFGLQFQEGAGGSSSIVGTFVSDTGARTMAAAPSYGSVSINSREMTIINGRKKITQVAAALSLTSHHCDAAQRYFLLAVQHNFIQGRRTQNVVAACLYIVCRREKAPLMLIDFSDVLQTNVYTLGSTFLKFKQLLNITLPVIDPSLYIHRFAAKLEFGAKKHLVAMSALRLVQSMKRDWIHHGRRPSGICGAALLIAARMHGFRRTQKEITQVVRICDLTLRKRLGEFEATPSSDLSLPEFNETSIEAEADPPAFALARERERDATKRRHDLLTAFNNGPAQAGLSFEDYVDQLELQVDQDLLEPPAKRARPLASPPSSSAPAAPPPPPSVSPPAEPGNSGGGDDNDDDEDDDLALNDDLDDDEVNACILSEAEVKLKTVLWRSVNREYLRDQKAKRRAAAAAGAADAKKKQQRKPASASQRKAKRKAKRKRDADVPKNASKIDHQSLGTLANLFEDDDV